MGVGAMMGAAAGVIGGTSLAADSTGVGLIAGIPAGVFAAGLGFGGASLAALGGVMASDAGAYVVRPPATSSPACWEREEHHRTPASRPTIPITPTAAPTASGRGSTST